MAQNSKCTVQGLMPTSAQEMTVPINIFLFTRNHKRETELPLTLLHSETKAKRTECECMRAYMRLCVNMCESMSENTCMSV